MAFGDYNRTWDTIHAGVGAAALPETFRTQQVIAAQPAAFADQRQKNFGNYVQGMGSYNQALAGIGNAFANNYGSYAAGLGNLAQARANALNNQNAQDGYNSMAAAAQQGAIGNIGAAALGAVGSAAGNAMQAWAQNQMAYNKAMSDLGAANQTGLSQLGQSRNNALGGLGTAYSKAGLGFGIASVLPGMFGGGGVGGGSFQATSPGGEIASGTYSGEAAAQRPGGDTSALRGMMDRTFAGLDATRADLNSTDMADRLDRNYGFGVNTLTGQHMSSRDMPSQMMGQALSGLYGLNAMNLGASQTGMDEYYRNRTDEPSDTPPLEVTDLLSGLTYGYSDSAGRIGGVQEQAGAGWRDAQRAFGDTNSAISDLYDGSIGGLSLWDRDSGLMDQLQRSRAALHERLTNMSLAGYSSDPNAEATLRMVEERIRQLQRDPMSSAGAFGRRAG